MDIIDALNCLSALSHETRLWVFRLLVQAGSEGLSAGEVADGLSSRQNTMSSHLVKLSDAGLITRRRQGRRVIYRASAARMGELTTFLQAEIEESQNLT